MSWIKNIDNLLGRDSIVYVFLFAFVTIALVILSFTDPSMRWLYLFLALFGFARTWRHLVLWDRKRND